MSSTESQGAQSAKQAIAEAMELQREGKLELAMQRYIGILERDPENVDALYQIALIALKGGQLDQGIKVIQRALDVGPPQARLHNLMGHAHLRLNQDEEALASFERAVACDPGFADAYGNAANVLADMGRLEEAVAAFDRALAVRPDNAEDICNRASVLADLGRLDEALAGYERALALMPDLAPAHYNRADILMNRGRLTEALASYDRAIALAPKMATAHSNRAVALKALGRLDEAKASVELALALDPNFTEAVVNRANVALEQGRFDDAQADYARALEAQPEHPSANFGRALACLNQGDWETGFRLFDYRERVKSPPYQPLPLPRWSGEPLAGERLVLLCEQGLGDMIQFARFAPLLAARGFDVTLMTIEAMRPLLSTLSGVAVAGIEPAPAGNGKPLRWLPLMSAPGVLGVRPENIPGDVPYLAAEPARIATWRERLGRDGFKIGINWDTGAARSLFAQLRAIPLTAFAPLAEIPGVRLISLQKGAPAAQIAQVAFRQRIEVLDTDPDPDANHFLDTAALMMGLDLIITCDTSVAHLAGALARPVFTALPLQADWRWLRERDDCPWYPTMRLFRQTRPRDWTDVFARIAAAVGETMNA